MGPIPLGALCPRNDAGGTLVRTRFRPDISWCGECRIAKRGSALDQLTKRNRRHLRGKRINSNAERSYICGVMGPRHHCCLARAFAVNPSRLPARPSGLRGLTAHRGQARGRPCHQCRLALAWAFWTEGRKECLITKKPLDSRRLI